MFVNDIASHQHLKRHAFLEQWITVLSEYISNKRKSKVHVLHQLSNINNEQMIDFRTMCLLTLMSTKDGKIQPDDLPISSIEERE